MEEQRAALPARVRRHRDKFRAVVTLSGQRCVGPIRSDPTEAAADAERMLAEHAATSGRITLERAFAALIAELREEGAAAGTIDYYVAHFRAITGPSGWGRTVNVREITARQVEAFARKRLASGVKAATVWGKEVQVLDRILGVVVRDGAIAENPVKRAKRPRRLPAVRFSVLPADRIAECCAKLRGSGIADTERVAAVVEFLFATGLRRSELGRLIVEDVELSNRRVWVRGKTGDAYVPMGELAERAFGALAVGRQPGDLLVGKDWQISRIFDDVVKPITGEPKLTAHVLRHSCATHLLECGMSVFEVARFMRHADPRMTFRYHHSSGATQRKAADLLRL